MHKELYIRWLNDAYSMEGAIDKMLTQQIKSIDDPEAQAKIEEHRDVTREQGELIKKRIEALGEDVSSMKAGSAKIFGILDGLAMGMPEDKLVKNIIGNYAVEAFEIASYSSLAEAARFFGDMETQQVCEAILRQEEEMAAWLASQIQTATQTLLAAEEREHAAA